MASDSIIGRSIASSEQAIAACTELEAHIAELRVAYEQYFLGNERVPPTKKHEDLKKEIRGLKGQFIKSTSAKFRVNNLAQKFATYERLWSRTLQEIENGTYRRDLLKAKRRKHDGGAAAKKHEEFHVDEDVDLSDDDDLDSAMAAAVKSVVSRPAAPAASTSGIAPAIKPLAAAAGRPGVPAVAPVASGRSGVVSTPAPGRSGVVPAPAQGRSGVVSTPAPASVAAAQRAVTAPRISAPNAPPRPAARPASGGTDGSLSDQKVKAIYDAYVMAKKRCGEDTRGLSLDSVSKTLRSQVPTLLKQHNAKTVEFKVVIKDGKAVLRALPKV